MRVEATAATVSWIPSEALSGLLRLGLEVGVAHHDDPPSDVLPGFGAVEALRDDDRLRFANVLGAWAEFDGDLLLEHGYLPRAESELERRLSEAVMRGGSRPEVRRLPAGTVVTPQGEAGDELFLVLDGVLAVEVDGRRLAEVGPGAVIGERALAEMHHRED